MIRCQELVGGSLAPYVSLDRSQAATYHEFRVSIVRRSVPEIPAWTITAQLAMCAG
jgi:hypothetical protein